MNDPRRHHYNPEFYLGEWAGADDLVCEIKKAYGKVEARRKSTFSGLRNKSDRMKVVHAVRSGLIQSERSPDSKRAGGVVVEPGHEVFLDVLLVGHADSPVKVVLKAAGLGITFGSFGSRECRPLRPTTRPVGCLPIPRPSTATWR
jgi:hypothetical protein